MCQSNYKATQLVGKDMNVQAAVGDVESDGTLDAGYGDVIGISVGESYTRQQLGQVNLSMKLDGTDKLINVPLTQFLPDGERQMWPINFKAGTKVILKLTIRVAGLAVATPIPLVFHCNKDACN